MNSELLHTKHQALGEENKHNNKKGITSAPLKSIQDFKSHKNKTHQGINQITGTRVST
jgi:hypothetical protein